MVAIYAVVLYPPSRILTFIPFLFSFSDMRDVFEYRVFHMGGDEVNLGKLDSHYAYLEPRKGP